MATYTIIPQPAERGFNIEIIGANGTRQTLLGFATEADAEAWIAADRAPGCGMGLYRVGRGMLVPKLP